MELWEHIKQHDAVFRPNLGPPPPVPYQQQSFGPPPPIPVNSQPPPAVSVQPTLWEQMGYVFHDLYPHSPQDSVLWLELFLIADNISRPLAERLVFFRAVGAWLVPDQQFGYVIQPIIDPTGMNGWESIEQYNSERDKHLTEYCNEIVSALRELRDRVRAGKVRNYNSLG